MTPREHDALAIIAEASPTMPVELARRLGVGVGHARELANRLHAHDLIAKQRISTGQLFYSVTAEGRQAMAGPS